MSKQSEQPATQPSGPAQLKLTEAEAVETWYVCPKIAHESRAAILWMEKHRPYIPEDNLVEILPLQQLTKRSRVYFLCRKDRGRKKISEVEPVVGTNKDGYREHKTLDPEDYFEEFQEFGPIMCSEYWRDGATRFESRLNYAAFTDKIAQLAAPFVIRWNDGNSCKPPTHPTEMYFSQI